MDNDNQSNSGRPTFYGKPMVAKISCYLTDEMKLFAALYGAGNIGAGIRRALQEAMDRQRDNIPFDGGPLPFDDELEEEGSAAARYGLPPEA
jgi:hypothetical protein